MFVELARPCPLDLNELTPESAPRFHCEHCNREVHVLSNMSEAEARKTLASPEPPCVAYLRGDDGQVRFRDSGRLLGVGALLISVAACAPHEDERVAAVDLSAFAATERIPPPPPRMTGGTPLQFDEPRSELKDESTPEFEALSKSLPDSKHFAKTEAARRAKPTSVIVEYCVDPRGRVVDAKRIRGDKELAEILLETIRRWRFKPVRRDGRPVRACTREHFYFTFESRDSK